MWLSSIKLTFLSKQEYFFHLIKFIVLLESYLLQNIKLVHPGEKSIRNEMELETFNGI